MKTVGSLAWFQPPLLLLVLLVVAVARGTSRPQRTAWPRKEVWTEVAALIHSHRHLADKDHDVRGVTEEAAGARWMRRVNQEFREWNNRLALAEYNFVTNITDDTQEKMLDGLKQFKRWMYWAQADGRKFEFEHFRPGLRRQFRFFTLSTEPTDPQKSAKIDELQSTMETAYNTAKVCLSDAGTRQKRNQGDSQCLPLEPDLQDVMANSHDPEELKRVWEGWRDVAGRPQRQRYERFVQLHNEGARQNGFSDFGEGWREALFPDNTDVEKMAATLWAELRPMYLQLHAYVRRRLKERYGDDVIGTDGTLPAHLLGNMWAQEWIDIYPLVTPHPQAAQSDDGMEEILKSEYNVTGLFRLSEKFFASIGLFNMTDTFWAKSMLVKPPDRDVQCHASATDMFSEGDFRIKMCSEVTMDYLETIHHEMGHVEYFMAYASQPTIFRDGANCAFHEAIGDTVALSVLSRTHLNLLGLVNSRDVSESKHINDLMKMALRKIAFLPFGLLVDMWRWRVFSNQTTPQHYNRDWWTLRLQLQGLRSPLPRSEEDFDPAAKFHVPSNSPYMCYFVSFVVQFQFYKALCEASGHKGALHLCDFDSSQEAGSLFKRLLSAGSSRPWPEVLEELTGSRHVSAQPIKDYFRPLLQWLQRDNEIHNEKLGWDGATINWKEE